MALSIVPVLLSLLGSSPEAACAGSVLVARILDESRAPLVSRDFWYGIECDELVHDSSASANYVGGTAHTDANGMLRIELDDSHSVGVARTLRLTLAKRDLANQGPVPDASTECSLRRMLDEPPQPPRLRPPYADCVLPASFVSGERDLGEQVLYAPGAPARFDRLSDAQLCVRYRAALAAVQSTNLGRNEALEEVLCELVRRATPACETFVAERLALSRRNSFGFGFEGDLPSLALLTAVRRIQHAPDPVVIAADTEHTIESTFPRFPTVAFELRNVDSERESLSLISDFLRYGLDGVGPSDEPLQVSRCAPRCFGGHGTQETLAHGGSLPASLDVASWLNLDRPGTYRLRVSLLPDECFLLERDLRGRIALLSPELGIRLKPLILRLSHAEHEQHLDWLRAVDATKTVPLLNERSLAVPVDPAARPASDWSQPADAPEERLYRAGFRALPALFDALDDAALDLPHRAWAVALLWNLTGVGEAGREGIGPRHARSRWPSLRVDAPIVAEDSSHDSAPLDEARLLRTIERWRRYRAFVEVEWTD